MHFGFPTDALSRYTLNFAGGVNDAYGVVDNIRLIHYPVTGEGGPTVTGLLEGPNPVAGPALVSFDGRSWNEIDALLPLPDGRFYAVGRSGVEAPEATPNFRVRRQDPSAVLSYVTRHMPDGSLDTSWGEQGRSDQPPELSLLHDLHIGASPATFVQPFDDGFLVRSLSSGGIVKLDAELNRDLSFGTNGVVPFSGALFTALPGGGVATLEGAILRMFDAAGQEQASTNVEDHILPLTFRNTANIGGGLDADAAGNIYVGVTNTETNLGEPVTPETSAFAGVAKFLPSLVLDDAYGHRGISRAAIGVTEEERPNALFVALDGRSVLGTAENDGDRNAVQFSPEGELAGGGRYHSALSGENNEKFLWDVSFLDDGQFALAVNHGRNDESWHSAVYESGGFFQSYAIEVPGVVQMEDFEIPRKMNGVFVAADGTFIVGGFQEHVDFIDTPRGPFVSNVDHHAALWRIDPAASDVVTVDFENAPLGTIASGVYTDGDFTFSSRPGERGPASEPLLVLGPPHGYASNVLQPFNWGRRIDVERSGGGTFSLAGFDYGSDQWDELGDFILTGTFAGGGTQTRTVTFSSKALTRLDLDWDNLTRVSINFAGGVNEAYGVVDNFVFAG